MNERVFLPHKKKKLTSFQIIILGFLGVILLGTVFLMLPVSTRAGTATPFSDALFTSTSAVCVTGLVMHDTATYWSFFGQVVILFLIQIGGLGVITVAASFAMISGKKISLMQRSTMQEAIAAPKVGGIVRLTNFMIRHRSPPPSKAGWRRSQRRLGGSPGSPGPHRPAAAPAEENRDPRQQTGFARVAAPPRRSPEPCKNPGPGRRRQRHPARFDTGNTRPSRPNGRRALRPRR